jgi:hypothetical protein
MKQATENPSVEKLVKTYQLFNLAARYFVLTSIPLLVSESRTKRCFYPSEALSSVLEKFLKLQKGDINDDREVGRYRIETLKTLQSTIQVLNMLQKWS